MCQFAPNSVPIDFSHSGSLSVLAGMRDGPVTRKWQGTCALLRPTSGPGMIGPGHHTATRDARRCARNTPLRLQPYAQVPRES
jgi:hypothetical protein